MLFGQDYIRYFTGFVFLSNERPVVSPRASAGKRSSSFRSSRSSEPAPRPRSRGSSPIRSTRGPSTRCGSSHACWPRWASATQSAPTRTAIPGSSVTRGRRFHEVTSARVRPLERFIERMMRRKSESEVELIRESARWCARAHSLLQEYSRPGVTETEASLRAGHEATLALLRRSAALGQSVSDGVSAGYRGQIGLRSSWAHAVAHNIEFQRGDVLVTETSAPIWGYNAELERAMVVGAADGRDAPPLRPHRRRPAGRVRGASPRRDVRRRRRRGHALLRGERAARVLAPARRPRDRPAQPRGAVPRRR